VLGSWAPNAGAPDFIAYLTDHVTRAVRWRESLELLFATHPGATFVEAGPGQVLGNMFGRRWIRPACVRTDPVGDHDPADWFRAAVNTLRTSS
jgi:malonyl CoA-acyl carrier protein transacylase